MFFQVLLNHDPTGPAFEHGERMHLNRLKLAVKLRQKKVSGFRSHLSTKHFSTINTWQAPIKITLAIKLGI